MLLMEKHLRHFEERPVQAAEVSHLRALRWALLIAAIALAVAFFRWPYGYYQLLRLVVASVAVWMAVIAHARRMPGWMLVGAAIALLHNPVWKIAFSRDVWAVLDWIVALAF